RQIVIGPGIETVDPLHPRAARGEHQHRRVDARKPPALENRQTVQSRQAEIQDDRSIVAALALLPYPWAVGEHPDGISLAPELFRYVGGDVAIVFAKQNAHRRQGPPRSVPSRASTRSVLIKPLPSRTLRL